MNPKDRWIIEPVPHLRIVGEELWQRVKERQDKTRLEITKEGAGVRSERARRPATSCPASSSAACAAAASRR